MDLEIGEGGIWEGAQPWLTPSCFHECYSVPAPCFILITILWVEKVGA